MDGCLSGCGTGPVVSVPAAVPGSGGFCSGGSGPFFRSGEVEALVLRALAVRGGEAAVVRRGVVSVVTGRPLGAVDWCPADPVAGVVAARELVGAARVLVGRWAVAARAAGRGWEELAGALRLDGDGAGLAAFDSLAVDAGGRFGDRWVSWRCGSCGRLVIDRGPGNPHPGDREDGHAGDCARHRGDVRAWEAGAAGGRGDGERG